jgi:acyl carrier protein
MSDLEVELSRMVAVVVDRPPGTINPEGRFEEFGNWSSLAALRLLSMIEQHLGVTFDLREYVQIETVDALAAAVRAQRRGTEGGQS